MPIKPCSRCQRYHSPRTPCGIPLGVTLGIRFGINAGGARRPIAGSDGSFPVRGRPKVALNTAPVLEDMLVRAKEHLGKVMEMLKDIPPAMPEYTELLDREIWLQRLIAQLLGQIAATKGVK